VRRTTNLLTGDSRGVGFGRRSFLCDVARKLQRAAQWFVLVTQAPDGLMVSSSAIPKTQVPVLPEPGLLHIQPWRRSHGRRREIELRYSHLTGWQDEANRLKKKMDTKPRDTKPTDLDLELAVFAAP
jgi:hypothetical protein